MMSKAQNKYIRSLSHQKYRKESNAFVVEGDKIAREWLASEQQIQIIVATEEWAHQHEELIGRHPGAAVYTAKESELAMLSSLKTANYVLLVVSMPANNIPLPVNEWCIALESIQDPGNMGTIIRIADWFGIRHIVCSPDCVDFYNSKVVQSAMGGHLRVYLHTVELQDFLKGTKMPVIAAVLDGSSVYNMERVGAAVLLIGNESKGLSDTLISLSTQKVTIPRRGGAESLNAGVSAGILCALLTPQTDG